MWRLQYFVLFEFCGFCTAAQVLVKTTCNIIWKKLQFTTEQRGQKFASDLSYSLFFKQVVIVFCSEYNICFYMFCRMVIIWVHGTTSRCIQRKTPPIRFCKIQTQADKHKHTYSKTNRGRPQQFGFSTRTNQFIKSHLLRRGVRSDAQSSSTETRFQKCSQSGKNGSKHPILSISMAYSVISCKKIERNTQKIKIADFTM